MPLHLVTGPQQTDQHPLHGGVIENLPQFRNFFRDRIPGIRRHPVQPVGDGFVQTIRQHRFNQVISGCDKAGDVGIAQQVFSANVTHAITSIFCRMNS